MFNRKPCKFCGKKVGKDSNFCYSCGSNLKEPLKHLEENEENFGMFGKNDFPNPDDFNIKLPMGFNMIFKSLVKELDKQFKDLNKEVEKEKKNNLENKKDLFSRGVSINISSGLDSMNGQPKIKIQSYGDMPMKVNRTNRKINKKSTNIQFNKLSNKQIELLTSLPKEEPETNVRRLSNKLIYEIILTDVKSEEDLSVKKLENSIEIKAIAENSGKPYKAYSKHIPLSYPLKRYNFRNERLVLEMDARQ
jgi:hypothetical protein